MPNLFWRRKGEPTIALVDTPFKSEDEFERYIHKDSEILSDVFILSRQVKTGQRTDIPDMVGIDAENNVVIIELKNKPVNEDIIPQVLRYAFWAETNPDSIRNLWLEQKNPPDIEIDWDNLSVRVIVMAPMIPSIVMRLVNKINYQVDLLELQRFAADEQEFILINKKEPETDLPSRRTKGIVEYDRAFYEANYNKESVALFYSVIERLDKLVEEKEWVLEKKFNKYYVGYKHGYLNVFGVHWLGSKSLGVFIKGTKKTFDKLKVPDWEPLRYEEAWSQILYRIDSTDTPIENLMSILEAVYKKMVV